jgi:hypothetical protein
MSEAGKRAFGDRSSTNNKTPSRNAIAEPRIEVVSVNLTQRSGLSD